MIYDGYTARKSIQDRSSPTINGGTNFIAQQQLKLQNSIMQAEGQNMPMENVTSELQNDSGEKIETQNYKLDLSLKEATYLTKILPQGYSLQIQSKIQKRPSTVATSKIPRSALTKKKSVDSKLLNEVNFDDTKNEQLQPQLNRMPSVRSKKPVNIKYNDESDIGYGKYVPMYTTPEIARRNTYQGLDQSLKPCVKILNLLKNSKTSWPFREPVDAISLGIPHYLEIVKQPMDLSKIQNNLKTGMYATPTQFHADINKIIRNSYTFNQGNLDFTRITEEFQQYYFKTIAQPNIDQKPVTTYQQPPKPSRPVSQATSLTQVKKSRKPQKPYSSDNPISLAQKKQLSINIRKLPRQHMKGIVDIVKKEGDNKIKDEFDLEDLRPETIRQLQSYVRSKLMEPAQRIAEGRAQGGRDANEQSEFSIESQEDS